MRWSSPVVQAIVATLAVGWCSMSTSQEVAICKAAHAHNDYLHTRPLLDALQQGFCSVEADIFLVDGELLVAHTRLELTPTRTLRDLYLEPLRKRIADHKGSVHGDGQLFTLLIDIKTDAAATYKILHQQLAEYSDVFESVEQEKINAAPVKAIVSGNRPIALISELSPRYVGIDGRVSDLNSDMPTHLLPLISDNWNSQFTWRGQGEISEVDRSKLDSIVQKAHQANRRIRFWAIPDNAESWAIMRDAGVDLINTDKLAELSEFLRSSR